MSYKAKDGQRYSHKESPAQYKARKNKTAESYGIGIAIIIVVIKLLLL